MARCGCTNAGCSCVVTVQDTPTIDMSISGDGSAGSPYIISGIALASSSFSVVAADTNCIDSTVVEAPTGTFTVSAVPKIDGASGNLLTCEVGGLRADLSTLDSLTVDFSGDGTPGNPLTATATGAIVIAADTNCIDTTVVEAPTGTFTVSAVPILATDPNALDCTATGLQVIPSTDVGNTMIFGTDGRLFTPSGGTIVQANNADETCVNVTVVEAPTGTFTISAAPVVAPDAPCNGLSCTATGLAVIPSADALNTLTCGTDGNLFVPAASSDVTITAVDTNCLNTTVVESPANTFTVQVDPILDPSAQNALTCGAAGLLVDVAALALDTPCIDTTVTGNGTVASPFVISAVPVISATVGNNITCAADGLFVPTGAATVTTADTSCIAVNGDGSGATPITAVPILDPSLQNALTCGASGLLVDVAATALDTNCINTTVTGNGTVASPFVISSDPIIGPECNGLSCTATGLTVTPSTDVGNNLVCGTDGNLFVPTGAATVTTADTQCIAVNGDGSGATPITAVPILDPSAQNALTCGAAGLLVDVAATALDTPCIDTTVTGNGTVASPFVISSAPIVDPSAQNVLTCGATGLLADVAAIALDTNCINTTVTGNGTVASPFIISSDPIIGPECNGLSCTATGLTVTPSTDAGNTLACGTDGNLFVPSSAVTTGCGLETVGGVVQANVTAWPFPCDQDANGPAIYCSPTDGHLQSGPLPHAVQDQSGACAPGPGFGNVISSLNLNIVGDPCRDEAVMIVTEASSDVDAPGLILSNIELDINGAGFFVAGSSFLPGANNSGGSVRSVTSQFVHSLLTIPAGTTLTISQRVRLTEATGAGTNTWIGGCVSSKAIGSTL